jgi:hypothetical protein
MGIQCGPYDLMGIPILIGQARSAVISYYNHRISQMDETDGVRHRGGDSGGKEEETLVQIPESKKEKLVHLIDDLGASDASFFEGYGKMSQSVSPMTVVNWGVFMIAIVILYIILKFQYRIDLLEYVKPAAFRDDDEIKQ